MDKRARYYKNKRYFESDDFKKSTGVKQGLRLCGNEDEIKVANQLSKFFKITFSKEGTFKTTSYVFNFLQPGEEFREYYNLYNEVLLLFSPYTEFESRTLDFVDKTLEEFDNRLDKVCVFLVSRDGDIETKINGLNTTNKDSRIIVPFTYAEILQNGISKTDISTKLMFMFDEIEHICFQTSDKEHWRNGEDYCMFWQTVRSVFQKQPECFTFLIAGVNPLCIETAYVNNVENPIFSMISIEYLNLFDLSNVKDMIGHIGKYMGLNFDEEIYTKLTEDYGGHPFLIRHICSLINKDISLDRPCQVSKYEYATKKKEYDAKIVHYVEMILGVLKTWYPKEYELLEILAVDGVQELKKNLEYKAKEMQHLLGYGIVKEVNENFYITINAVNLYLENTHKLQGKKTSKEQAWSEVSKRRNVLEDKLRKIMLLRMTMQYGSKKVKGKLLEVVESGRKEREKLQDLEINDLIENHFYLLDVKQVILKNWSLFDVTFIDKVKFENFLDVINKYRIDAHAKTIEESDLLMLTLAFNWFDERIEDLPV